LITPTIVYGQPADHDSTLPIEITADSLEVVQEQQLATFIGDVDAVQGDLVLSADLLRVYYDSQGEPAGLATGSGGAIRRIEAEGHVSLASPEEAAKGDAGVYDVKARVVTLEGSVVLTRDENVIRGDRLEMDLDQGVSRMLTAEQKNGDPGATDRVKALFTPRPAESDRAGPDRPAVPAPKPR
jgi:lipopolysaccharide export system protein LptA